MHCMHVHDQHMRLHDGAAIQMGMPETFRAAVAWWLCLQPSSPQIWHGKGARLSDRVHLTLKICRSLARTTIRLGTAWDWDVPRLGLGWVKKALTQCVMPEGGYTCAVAGSVASRHTFGCCSLPWVSHTACTEVIIASRYG